MAESGERPQARAGRNLSSLLICGAGHSGSTLLGMVLGGHSNAFYIGEGAKARYLGDANKPERKRVCKICGPDCPVWGEFRWDAASPLHPELARRLGAEIIVDSTKQPAWIEARGAEALAAGGVAGLILLTRDGRAVVNSRLRKYPERDAEGQIRDWARQMGDARALYERFQGPKTVLAYEQLATSPEAEVRRLCSVFGLEYQSSMLAFTAREHHVLGGNSGAQFVASRARTGERFVGLNDRTRSYYESHSGRIELDMRWRTELAPAHLALFESVAGDINSALAWE
jgi:hypothetical protein